MDKYIPPFQITPNMLNLIADIMEKLGKLDTFHNLSKMPVLRRNNRINSIHSSLAIEANSLTLDEVKDVINGKMVIGPEREIREVQNAYKAYEMINDLNPYSILDLKKAHEVMTHLTVTESGEFRKGNEGVFDDDVCIFIAPKPELVPSLMQNLFDWMKKSKDKIHPLILSSVFHYEFVFIHPFSDGNGRIARLWQNVILTKWKGIFEYLPIETQIKKYQSDYYRAIANSNKNGNSTAFIEFMLKMINDTLNEFLLKAEPEIAQTNNYVSKLLDVMDYNIPMTATEIMQKLGIKSKETFRKNYLDPAIENGLVKMTIPDKPTSKNQMYYRT